MTETKTIIAIIMGVGAYLLKCFSAAIVVLAIFMIMDYIAGVTLALKNKEFDPQKGIWGAVKKLFYIFLVLMGFLLDLTISSTAQQLSLGLDTRGMLGIAVTVYLISTEGISTLKSFVGLGLPVPPFLSKAFGYIKDETGRLIKIPEKKDECNE